MPQYLVLLHDDVVSFAQLSPTDMQAVIQKYSDWVGKLSAAGRLESGKKLKDDGGQLLRYDKGRMVVSQGPYAEARDMVGGFFMINASSYDDARSLLSDCPHFDFGWVELREVDNYDN